MVQDILSSPPSLPQVVIGNDILAVQYYRDENLTYVTDDNVSLLDLTTWWFITTLRKR
jgi:hypothetical protein